MSLSSRIRQIAGTAIKGYVSNLTQITQSNTMNTGNVQMGQITSFDGSSYTVTYSDGTTASVPPGGLRPLNIGTSVLVGGGQIIG